MRGRSPHEERNFRIIVYAVAVVVLRHRREFDGYETAFSGKRSKTLPIGEAKHLKHQPVERDEILPLKVPVRTNYQADLRSLIRYYHERGRVPRKVPA